MTQTATLSENLRTMYDDMVEAYSDAKINDNVPGQERLSKVIRDLSKQIKEHEIHEKETIPRKEAIRFSTNLCAMVGRVLKEFDGKTLDAGQAIVAIVVLVEELSETELK